MILWEVKTADIRQPPSSESIIHKFRPTPTVGYGVSHPPDKSSVSKSSSLPFQWEIVLTFSIVGT